MANLIPAEQINPTNLYETIERCKKSNDALKGCTEKTVNAYRTALTEANAYLDALFQKNAEGVVEPTAENVAGNQGKADGYATTLSKATAELARTLDRYGDVSLALDAIPALCDLADEAVSNTALNGRKRHRLPSGTSPSGAQKQRVPRFFPYDNPEAPL